MTGSESSLAAVNNDVLETSPDDIKLHTTGPTKDKEPEEVWTRRTLSKVFKMFLPLGCLESSVSESCQELELELFLLVSSFYRVNIDFLLFCYVIDVVFVGLWQLIGSDFLILPHSTGRLRLSLLPDIKSLQKWYTGKLFLLVRMRPHQYTTSLKGKCAFLWPPMKGVIRDRDGKWEGEGEGEGEDDQVQRKYDEKTLNASWAYLTMGSNNVTAHVLYSLEYIISGTCLLNVMMTKTPKLQTCTWVWWGDSVKLWWRYLDGLHTVSHVAAYPITNNMFDGSWELQGALPINRVVCDQKWLPRVGKTFWPENVGSVCLSIGRGT